MSLISPKGLAAFIAEHGRGARWMYVSGHRNTKQLAKYYKVSESTIQAAFREMKVTLHPRIFWDKRGRRFSHERAIQRYLSGLSMRAVARESGVSKNRIAQILEANGIERRPQAPGPRTCIRTAQIKTLLCRGFSRRYICEATRVSKSAVARVEAALGAPPRTSPLYRVWVERLARQAA